MVRFRPVTLKASFYELRSSLVIHWKSGNITKFTTKTKLSTLLLSSMLKQCRKCQSSKYFCSSFVFVVFLKSLLFICFIKSVISRRKAFNFLGCLWEMVDDFERGNICLSVCWLSDAVYKRAWCYIILFMRNIFATTKSQDLKMGRGKDRSALSWVGK